MWDEIIVSFGEICIILTSIMPILEFLMPNPFICGTVVSGDDFANQEHELRALTSKLKETVRIVLFAPRRYGKTSLIKKAGFSSHAQPDKSTPAIQRQRGNMSQRLSIGHLHSSQISGYGGRHTPLAPHRGRKSTLLTFPGRTPYPHHTWSAQVQ